MTAGMKTSEMWITVSVVVMGAVAATFSDQPWAQAAGAIAAALASAGYGLSRSRVKQQEIEEKGYTEREVARLTKENDDV